MATKAITSEVAAQPIEVTWRDQKFTIRPVTEWQLRFAHWADRDKMTLAMEAMLGTVQYERIVFAEPPATDAEMVAFAETVFSAWGVDMGEALASTAS